MKLLCPVLCSLLLLPQVWPRAEAASFTLETAAAHALRHNADLAAARFGIEEARGRFQQSGRLANPALGSELKPGVNGREGGASIGFMQRFPLTSRLRLERQVSAKLLTVAVAEVRDAERRLAAQVRTAAVQVLALEAQLALKERQLANNRALGALARKIAGTGEGPTLDALHFDLEAQQLVVQSLQLDSARTTVVGGLLPLLGLAGTETIEFTDPLPEPAATVADAPALGRRPDHQAAQARTEAARQAVLLARANRWEDAGVGLFGAVDRTEDVPDGLRTDGFVGLRFSLPLPFWNRNQGRVHEATATAARAVKEVEALASRIRAEAAAAEAEMRATARLAGQLTNVLLPQAVQLEERLTRFHREGQSPLADTLRAREKRLQMEAIRLDAVRDFHLARVRLLAATGTILTDPEAP